MKSLRVKRQRLKKVSIEMNRFVSFFNVILFLLLTSIICLVISFQPLSKQEHIDQHNKMAASVEPFRKNLSDCARQTKASMVDVENFLKRIPQASMQGKCFVACILKRNAIIKNNKIQEENLLEANKEVYGADSEVLVRLKNAIDECTKVVQNVFEICEFASMFNDCMHMKMEHILDKVTMERRMEALGQMTSNPEEWTEDDDELLRLIRDEL